MSYELEQVLDKLEDEEVDRKREIAKCVHKILNNPVSTFGKSSTTDDISVKRAKLLDCLTNQIRLEEPKNYPRPTSDDLFSQITRDTKNEILEQQKLYQHAQHRFKDIENDIKHYETKNANFRIMQEAFLDGVETLAGRTYQKEYSITKRLFQEIKKDLHTVVETLFPNNPGLKEYLARLTTGYAKGGDDVYVSVRAENLDYVNFLLEAGIVIYHRNDKSKVRLAEML